MAFYKGGLRIKEQHLIIIDGFRFPKDEPFLEGPEKAFYAKAIGFMLFMLAMKFLFAVFLPGILSIILMIIFIPLFVVMVFKIVYGFNEKVKKTGASALFQYFFIILALLAVSGVSYGVVP